MCGAGAGGKEEVVVMVVVEVVVLVASVGKEGRGKSCRWWGKEKEK